MVSFHWGKYEPAELRFENMRYRAGGPWLVKRTVHDLDGRYGISFQTRKGWRFLGLVCLENQRTITEPEADSA